MDLSQPILETVIGLGTVIAGTLVVNKYSSLRDRQQIDITPVDGTSQQPRLGFQLRVKKKSLDHPRVLFFGGYATKKSGPGELHICDLYDENGNIYKDDFISAGGRPVRIYPLLAKHELGENGVKITVTDVVTRREVLSQYLPTKGVGSPVYSFAKEASENSFATIQISAHGLEREEVRRFKLGLVSNITKLGSETVLWYSLKAEKEHWPWTTI